MHIGLIGGIGPAATEFYYRTLVEIYARAGRRLDLTIANADAREMIDHLERGQCDAQAAIFARYIDSLKAGGCGTVALTSIGGHFCIKELERLSSLPVISALTALDAHLLASGIDRVGVLGTRAVMESRLYGSTTVQVVTVSPAEMATAHSHYVEMAVSGAATVAQRAYFEHAARRMVDDEGARAVVLGGTDLFLAFGQSDYPFRLIDSARIHAEAIAQVGLA